MDKIFRDPVHNDIHITNPIIYDLTNTAEFQRLRRIKQVPTTSFTFHGAEHSRFSHCLGVYDIARRVTEYFEVHYSSVWNQDESLLTMAAALLHDIGHGAYSHTFEMLFKTDHEALGQELITSPQTEINTILRRVSPDFPDKVASVINHTYPNKQVVQLISSQIDCDRMDYLLRDSYYTGTNYGQFDLTRILTSMRPNTDGIVFDITGMHAVEDYLVSRYQMYMQVYFHPASRAIEVLLQNLLKRARRLYHQDSSFFTKTSPLLVPFFEETATLSDYLLLDDGVLNTYFQAWMTSEDKILNDLASRFIRRQLFASVTFDKASAEQLDLLRELVTAVGFDAEYYTAEHHNFDLPYDIYRPESKKPRTQIEILQKNGKLAELSSLSPLVSALSGSTFGDQRFYFPKDMMIKDDLFVADKEVFLSCISDGHFSSLKISD
ncbi:HD domain-containing protein [Streptococcus sp. S784/96/1]|uniref:HD domain-containing protein n=1 Tax=Streptococcus sp. S784/96/1 TaxID=2653499 RepID=UPI0013866BA2|nr:HD domain-containing protein [Streptococcus sp. S784/96/1]